MNRLLVICSTFESVYIRAASRTAQINFPVVLEHNINPYALAELRIIIRKYKPTHIATTFLPLLRLVCPQTTGTPNDNYGTKVYFESTPVIFIPSFKTITSTNEGKFIIAHYLDKLANGGMLSKDKFSWKFCIPEALNAICDSFATANLIAIDIETSRHMSITSCSYTAWWASTNTTSTVVVRVDLDQISFAMDAMRRLNSLPPPKVMQNGKYDSCYFLRFNLPVNNWIYDTAYLQHSIFPELPKDLAFISSFYLDNFIYWKDESGQDLYAYNGKDTHNTLWTFLAQLVYINKFNCQYGADNYVRRFPVNFPCISCAMDGMLVNEEQMNRLREESDAKRDHAKERLGFLLSSPGFNPGSPLQVLKMFKALDYHPVNARGKKTPATDKKAMRTFYEASPVYVRIADYIKTYRNAAKASSTYFTLDLFQGRLLYEINPHGTDTARMASKASPFWCGTQIQNIPQYGRVMCYSEDGWTFGAVDKAQSESYCTAYLTEDLALIDAVNNSPDFHCQNASAFFGIPFGELFDASIRKVLRKDIRDVAKRVNHGANYNMQATVLLETMGTAAVLEAKRLLNLPLAFTLKQVCMFLLDAFDKTYPEVRGSYFDKLKIEVATTGKLTLPDKLFTRRTFLRPERSKLDLNSVVAHKAQCLSTILVERAFVRVWRELQLGKYSGSFRINAPVHDEILFIAKDEIIDSACHDVADMMTIPTMINGRLMTIPSTIAKGKLWSEAK